MKTLKRLSSILLAVFMVMAMAIPAFAQDVTVAGNGKASITISNAAKGETYTIYKLFDATVTGNGNGSIAYTGTIPSSLSNYFTKDTAGNISETAAARNASGEMSDDLRTALKTWAASSTTTETASAVSDGSELKFKNLPYGYYVVTTTQGAKAITVDSTNPDADIYDKNSTTPSNLTKLVNGKESDEVNIGDTVTYTVSFKTSNYDGAGDAAKKIMSYTIEDTLPDFLSDVTVNSIIVDSDGDTDTTDDRTTVTASFVNKKIVLDWYDEEAGQFRYDNGATVILTYQAKVTDTAAIAGEGNTNTVTLTWIDEDDGEHGELQDSATIYTYAMALKKVNDQGDALAGAEFRLPFYVKAPTQDSDGAYIYAGTTPGEGLTNQLTTPTDGAIVVKGVKTGTYSITEVTAPNGYNKLTAPVEVEVEATNAISTDTTFYIMDGTEVTEDKKDETGVIRVIYTNDDLAATAILVINKTGAELPSTGGMGTTIFYIAGTVLVLGAGLILVTRRRMSR